MMIKSQLKVKILNKIILKYIQRICAYINLSLPKKNLKQLSNVCKINLYRVKIKIPLK